MTIDSQYKPETYTTDGDHKFTFEFESLGSEAVQVYLIDENGDRIPLIQENT